MSRRILLLALLLTLGTSCRRAQREPASSFNVSDPDRAEQLLFGFHEVEAKGARWAAREFGVALVPPEDAAGKGARLVVRLFIPDAQIREIGAMTLVADIDGHPLASETFESGGMWEYRRDLPPDLLDTNIVPVHFSFDRAVAPSAGDGRELGAVISDVGLEAR